MRSLRSAAIVGVVAVAVAGCAGAGAPEPTSSPGPSVPLADGASFESATLADFAQAYAGGDGDLWPNCWGDDDRIYTAHGDGTGFGGGEFADIGTDVIAGDAESMSGETTAIGDDVGTVWSGDQFTRKPTGMACVGGAQYLAVQDLRLDFNQAPAASISKSTDGGATWTWDETAPMFDDGVFTTIFFLDYGKDYDQAPDDFVYAYGLDGNWRDSFDDSVPDPVDVYLARVPADAVQDRASWEFFTGTDGDDPAWSSSIDDRVAVLHDDRRLYTDADASEGTPTAGAADLSVISQGGVVYNPGLDRYLYTSWTELTFEFYEAENPWGPWNLFLSRDFGPYPWSDAFGGYGTTIPSKFISADGHDMWVQANVCPCAPSGISVYDFALRRMTLD